MDERDTSIAAQVAVKAATEIMVARIQTGAPGDYPTLVGEYDQWYTHIGQGIISTVKRSVVAQQPVTAAPPVGQPQNEWDRPQGPVQQPQQSYPPAQQPQGEPAKPRVFLQCGCGQYRRQLTSKRTGRQYWVNSDPQGNFSAPNDFHDCSFMEPAA